MGVSVDSVYSHTNWGRLLGGISFPLVADFHPKGALANSLNLYLADKGITDRATVIIDAGGTIQYHESVGAGGERNIEDLAKACEEVNSSFSGSTSAPPARGSLSGNHVLYVKDPCMFSENVLAAAANLHLLDKITVKNVSEDQAARDELSQIAGKDSAPCLVVDGKAKHESGDIIRYFVDQIAPV